MSEHYKYALEWIRKCTQGRGIPVVLNFNYDLPYTFTYNNNCYTIKDNPSQINDDYVHFVAFPTDSVYVSVLETLGVLPPDAFDKTCKCGSFHLGSADREQFVVDYLKVRKEVDFVDLFTAMGYTTISETFASLCPSAIELHGLTWVTQEDKEKLLEILKEGLVELRPVPDLSQTPVFDIKPFSLDVASSTILGQAYPGLMWNTTAVNSVSVDSTQADLNGNTSFDSGRWWETRVDDAGTLSVKLAAYPPRSEDDID